MSLALEDVDVVLDGRPIVDDVDARRSRPASGSRSSGPSGSGKSTMLRVAPGSCDRRAGGCSSTGAT